ncbi:MAG: M56 family metallopeptidase [Oscillospiraceae bacterium]|nr:M56 family metallopeptidase [Oscillospiraceae bacterium]
MLASIFYILLNMSIAGTVCITAVLLLRKFRKLPRRLICGLWGLALVRLMLPFTVSVPFSLFNFTGNFVKQVFYTEQWRFLPLLPAITESRPFIELPQSTMPVSCMNAIGFAYPSAANFVGAAQPVRITPGGFLTFHTTVQKDIFTAFAWIWLIGAILALAALIWLYRQSRQPLKAAKYLRGNVYRSPAVDSPVLVGLFRPKILLPLGLDPDSEAGQMVIAHEQIHRRRRDNLFRLAAMVIICFHWFNPFAWVLLRLLLRDTEQAVDSAVTRRYSAVQRKTYAAAMLRFAIQPNIRYPAFVHHFSRRNKKSQLSRRITAVLYPQRFSSVGLLFSVLIFTAATLLLLTNPI